MVRPGSVLRLEREGLRIFGEQSRNSTGSFHFVLLGHEFFHVEFP
jgi:hypothetical protein